MAGRRSLALLLLLGLAFGDSAWAHRIQPTALLRGARGPLLGDEMECQTCHVLTRVVSDYLCDFDLLSWMVVGTVDNVCSAVPEDDREVCAELVVVLLPMGVDFVRRSATPGAVCANVCGAEPPAKASTSFALATARDDAAECAQCEYVVSWIKEQPERQWRSASEACASLPDKLAASCTAMVDKWGSMLQAVIALDRPCDLLGSCTWSALTAASRQAEERGRPLLAAPRPLIQAAQQAMARVEQQQQQQLQMGQLEDATPCDKCKMTVLEVRLFLNNKQAQAMVLNTSLMLCGKLAPYEQQCKDALTKYAPVVFDLIDKDFKPDFVCQLMHICPASVAASEVVPLAGAAQHVQGGRSKSSSSSSSREESASGLGMLLWEESVASRDEEGGRASWFSRSKQQS